ncbi:fibronectin type III domain-containing protein [Pseudomonas jessenii]|uniref:fibronectin type III domain-containing protein n=1 Tax=Pseudomonas jessenii TaxID=77298 RepID=UPI003892218B
MRDEIVGTSDNSEIVPFDDIAPQTNYSRWMTDMAAEIAHLKLYQLAIPGAHNSGVDRSGSFNVGKNWAACQYNSFSHQLAAGARYLDLRLYDSSYKKDIGGSKIPRYKFVEIFEFKHNVVSVGRRLEHLVQAVKSFTDNNPGEIVIIDFDVYDKGRNHSNTSLERCLPKFNPIKDRLIPLSANDMSIGEIRRNYPGCNVVLCLDHGYPVPSSGADKWPSGVVRREQIWGSRQHLWNPEDSSESGIISLVSRTMSSPPETYWVLSAAVTEQLMPKDLPPSSRVRTEVFKPRSQNANILMVDFIDGSNSKVSVVDKCIALNRLRGADKAPPLAPTNFVVTTKDEDSTGGKFENTLVFKWTPAVDDLGVRKYVIYRDGVHFVEVSGNYYEHKNFSLRNYSFKVKAVDNSGNESGFSSTFDLIQDTVPPTTPTNIYFQHRPPFSYTVYWNHSIDTAGVEGYELYLDGVFKKFVPYNAGSPYTTIDGMSVSRTYEVKIRAKDINGFYSEYATRFLYPDPQLMYPGHSITDYNEVTKEYGIQISWGITENCYPEIFFEGETGASGELYFPVAGEAPTFSYRALEGEYITHRCRKLNSLQYDRGVPYFFTFTAIPPDPVTNLKITSRTQENTSISWTKSSNAANYAISLDEESPVLVSSSESSYTFKELPLGLSYQLEVWAINNVGGCSSVESLTIPVVVALPDPPTNFRYTLSDVAPFLEWDAPSQFVKEYRLKVTGRLAIDYTAYEPCFSVPISRPNTRYEVRITAYNDAGESLPLISEFTTK